MDYQSLFDRIVEADPDFRRAFKHQRYFGTLEDILEETSTSLNKPNDELGVIRQALHPPRIIRAVIDYKVENPQSPKVEFLVRDAIKLGLNVYRGSPCAAGDIEELKRKIIETGNLSLLGSVVKQVYDDVTWIATNPRRSSETANNLIMDGVGQPVIFVALGHGGVAAGMDTYLRYCDGAGENGSTFYVVRFSNRKLGDVAPRLNTAEISYLQEQAKGRKPVIFDEDKFTGITLGTAEQFFNRHVFPEKTRVLTNYDMDREHLKGSSVQQKLLSQTFSKPWDYKEQGDINKIPLVMSDTGGFKEKFGGAHLLKIPGKESWGGLGGANYQGFSKILENVRLKLSRETKKAMAEYNSNQKSI